MLENFIDIASAAIGAYLTGFITVIGGVHAAQWLGVL